VLSASNSEEEAQTDSDESLSADYPKGWAPKLRGSDNEVDELPEEDYMSLQEAAENSVSTTLYVTV